MYVLATAGHVDHGKSTLVRALTGMEPDRWAAERDRGLTIDLGFAWTTLPSGEDVAFVDVPGHERFISNMLAGVAAAPGVVFVVAADGGWSRQSEEHLLALEALGVRHGLLVVTRCDLADPEPALGQARARIAESGLRDISAIAVSARTGQGLADLLAALDKLVVSLPSADPTADVRFWLDRSFAVKGLGTVVTGTLTSGTVSVGDQLTAVGPQSLSVEVRGLQSLQQQHASLGPVSRVAVNLRGVAPEQLGRGWALVTPQRWLLTDTVDVRITAVHPPDGLDAQVSCYRPPTLLLPAQLMLHIGTAQLPVRARVLGGDTARLQLPQAAPLRIADVAVLRDPAQRAVLAKVTVLDVAPPALNRRGAARRRAAELVEVNGASLLSELRRRKLAHADALLAMGIPATALRDAQEEAIVLPGRRYADRSWWLQRGELLASTVDARAQAHPESPGLPLELARQATGLADRTLVEALVSSTPTLSIESGAVFGATRGPQVPEQLQPALNTVLRGLQLHPFRAPEAAQLAELRLTTEALARLVAAKQLLHVGRGIYLLPTAIDDAAAVLATVPQPFSLSQARQALDTTRRVAVPLLELLDQRRITVRNPDSSRRLRHQ